MKKNMLPLLFASLLAPVAADAAFIVAEDAVEPAQRAPSLRTREIIRAEAPPARVVAAARNNNTAFGQVRTYIRHKGRKPAVFGKPVTTQADTTLGALVADVIPDQFQAFASGGVDMGAPVKGGKFQDWIAAFTTALRSTDYTATVDWDKREVSFDVESDEALLAGAKKREKPAKMWEVRIKDGLLSQVLGRWCSESNGECARFINQSSRDLVIEGEMVATGDFSSAVNQLMSAVSDQSGQVFRWKISANNILILSDDSAGR